METNQRFFVALSDDVPLGVDKPMFGIYDHEAESTEWAIRQVADRDQAERIAALWNAGSDGRV